MGTPGGFMDAVVDGGVVEGRDTFWVNRALCVIEEVPVEAFFVEPGRVLDPEVARMCRRCPVRVQCAVHAWRSGNTAGYYGGLSAGQRQAAGSVEELVAMLDEVATTIDAEDSDRDRDRDSGSDGPGEAGS